SGKASEAGSGSHRQRAVGLREGVAGAMNGCSNRAAAVCRLAAFCALAMLVCTMVDAARLEDPATPMEHRRGGDQTFLTFPEWFLVYSPAEYAAYVTDRAPSRFPFIGHVC